MMTRDPSPEETAADSTEQVDTDVMDSNPNAAGPQQLAGGMGVSSERTGPYGSDPAVAGVQGTGTHGTAAEGTDGVSNTSRTDVVGDPADEPDEPDEGVHGAGPSPATGIDRTVGETNPAQVPGHDFDPTKNPGHSHG